MLSEHTPFPQELCHVVNEYAIEFFDFAAEIRALPKNQRGNSLFPLLAGRCGHAEELTFDGIQVRELVHYSYPPKSSLEAQETIRNTLIRDFFSALTALRHLNLLNIQFYADFETIFALPEICHVRICSPLQLKQWSKLQDVLPRYNARLTHISSKATDNGTEFDLCFFRERVPTMSTLADRCSTLPAAVGAVAAAGAPVDGSSTLSATAAQAPVDVVGHITQMFVSRNIPYRLEIGAGIVLQGAESVSDLRPYFTLGELLRLPHLRICGKLNKAQLEQLAILAERFHSIEIRIGGANPAPPIAK
jgi:hypothetical protein